MVAKKIVLLASAVLLLLGSGCVATIGRQNASETRSLRNQVLVLENELKSKDEEISNLRDALQMKKTDWAQAAGEIKSRPNSKQIQMALTKAGYYQGPIDGRIGKQTRQAIKKFQKENNLSVDGKVGKKTWSLLSKYLY
jgi:murein L,D-transpeptidase YcbB/YkuD